MPTIPSIEPETETPSSRDVPGKMSELEGVLGTAHALDRTGERADDLDAWIERCASTCPGGGCRSIGDDGRCSTCGATKAPSQSLEEIPR